MIYLADNIICWSIKHKYNIVLNDSLLAKQYLAYNLRFPAYKIQYLAYKLRDVNHDIYDTKVLIVPSIDI